MTQCLSNERQIGLGVLQYVEDYDETFPCGVGNNPPDGAGWAGQVYPYIKSVNVFACPDDPHSFPTVSYGINQNLTSSLNHASDNTPLGYPQKLSFMNAPAKTVLVGETAPCKGWTVESPSLYGETTSASICGVEWSSWNGMSLGVSASICTHQAMGNLAGLPVGDVGRHTNGNANYLLADGHSKYFSSSRVSGGWNASSPSSDETTLAWTSHQAAGTEFSGNSAVTNGPFDATFSAI